ncbi:TetR/AcrR family transcriptional regulator [Streptomyces spongiae]|uniref:TetR/AcrR family transcriptional regulator n=1 Tax=Streptomyces spongiae TaxID=565072 RepID=A0A5N8XA56_9ACTN|nr:TetR/AcrR family transcriptional regulator [Streptomyces spongiae]MPY56381.1 TetR/AcrR family transcriptional regulator [Streptomyces spongiae]
MQQPLAPGEKASASATRHWEGHSSVYGLTMTPTPAPGRTVLQDDSAERILDAAAALFIEGGYEGTSVSSIAKSTGMTAAALYWHFPSKIDILFAVLERDVREGYAEVEKAVRSQEPRQRLREYVDAFVRQQIREAETRNFSYSTLISSLPQELRQEMLKLGAPYIDLLRGILTSGREAGVFEFADVRVTAFAISTMCEYVFTWFRANRSLSQDAVCALYTDLAVRMVSTPPAL